MEELEFELHILHMQSNHAYPLNHVSRPLKADVEISCSMLRQTLKIKLVKQQKGKGHSLYETKTN